MSSNHPCANVMLSVASATILPTVLSSITIIVGLTLLNIMSTKHAIILGLVVCIVSMLPLTLNFMFQGNIINTNDVLGCIKQYFNPSHAPAAAAQMRQSVAPQPQLPPLQTPRGYYPRSPSMPAPPRAPAPEMGSYPTAPLVRAPGDEDNWMDVFGEQMGGG